MVLHVEEWERPQCSADDQDEELPVEQDDEAVGKGNGSSGRLRETNKSYIYMFTNDVNDINIPFLFRSTRASKTKECIKIISQTSAIVGLHPKWFFLITLEAVILYHTSGFYVRSAVILDEAQLPDF